MRHGNGGRVATGSISHYQKRTHLNSLYALLESQRRRADQIQKPSEYEHDFSGASFVAKLLSGLEQPAPSFGAVLNAFCISLGSASVKQPTPLN